MLFSSLTRLSLLSLLALPAVLAAAGAPSPVPVAPTPVRRGLPELDFNPAHLTPRSLALNPADPTPRVLTNAQRLARGLPPRSPALNRHSRRARALAPRQSSAPCSLPQETGRIRAVGLPGDIYVARTDANGFGEYGMTDDPSQALSVVLHRCTSNSDPFQIEAVNGIAAYPYFGGVVGFANSDDNLGPGSSNYVYIAGTSSVPAGPAQPAPNAFTASTGLAEDVESTLWTLTDANVLVPTWINTDGTAAAPGTTLVYVQTGGAFALVGDVAAFVAQFGPATPVVSVSWCCGA
ncbi:hypothetical protein PYCCODRAFT_1419807 [Trametes coccinea BRFM310]|uniref:Uncharacterized protein n=1 Tax=Trametes coccinea (strain BRFM310) TaxID=1353009 RepID=A0A1Y2I810_TRAC3|nr:hypothetical protein PYCCODRAFT_1419807 [Trametes coccinea BRFM310]